MSKSPTNAQGTFLGYALLSEGLWDREEFINTLKDDWDIDLTHHIDRQLDGDDSEDALIETIDNNIISVCFCESKMAPDEVMHRAQTNYFWLDAPEIVKHQQAYVRIGVLGTEKNALEASQLFVKLMASAAKQHFVLGIYANSTIYEPSFYYRFAFMMEEDLFPIYNLIWVGVYQGRKGGYTAYTQGMRSFGYDELEIHDVQDMSLIELHKYICHIARYVLLNRAPLLDGAHLQVQGDISISLLRGKSEILDAYTYKIKREQVFN